LFSEYDAESNLVVVVVGTDAESVTRGSPFDGPVGERFPEGIANDCELVAVPESSPLVVVVDPVTVTVGSPDPDAPTGATFPPIDTVPLPVTDDDDDDPTDSDPSSVIVGSPESEGPTGGRFPATPNGSDDELVETLSQCDDSNPSSVIDGSDDTPGSPSTYSAVDPSDAVPLTDTLDENSTAFVEKCGTSNSNQPSL
jgi:hypothetical protein